MRRLIIAAVLACAAALAGCSSGTITTPQPTESVQAPQGGETYETQLVNNALYMRHVESRLQEMAPPDQLHYLGVQSCATQSAVLGVFGPVGPQPLLVRLNWLKDRYGQLNQSPAPDAPVTIEEYEDQLCADDKPKG